MQWLKVIVSLLLLQALVAETPSPSKIERSLKRSIQVAAQVSVSVKASGLGTGVVISKNGHILTAAHLLDAFAKENKHVIIEFNNGTSYRAQVLGLNREADIGLVKILSDEKLSLPYASITKKLTPTGAVIFTYSHPGGKIKNRNAQARIGRITATVRNPTNPHAFYFSDMNIQPGDSGGPVFTLDGDLIAINSSAATQLNFSIHTALTNYLTHQHLYLQGKRWGNVTLSPTHSAFLKVNFTPAINSKIEQELFARADLHHPPTTDFFRRSINKEGKVNLNRNQIISFMGKDAIAIAKNASVSLGIDDPKILHKLPRTPQGFAAHSIADAKSMKQVVARATCVGDHFFITKSSAIQGIKNLVLVSRESKKKLSILYHSKELDLSLLKVTSESKYTTIKLPKKITTIIAGTALTAPDSFSRPLFSIASDRRDTITQKSPSGMSKNSPLLTTYNVPYGPIIRHTLPLFDQDIGTPIFNLKGECIGMHSGRVSKSTGICIPHEYISAFLDLCKKQNFLE